MISVADLPLDIPKEIVLNNVVPDKQLPADFIS